VLGEQMATIRNPIEWSADQVRLAILAVEQTGDALGERADPAAPVPLVRRIALADLRAALAAGVRDFGYFRTDVIFLCLVYPAIGLVLWRLVTSYDMLPLVFPLASGFALVGPFAGVGLYEMSRRRELGLPVSWAADFAATRSRAFGKIMALGLGLVLMFVLWLAAAQGIYDLTLGPEPPASMSALLGAVVTTVPGWTLLVAGCGVGFVFAAVALAAGFVSFPLLLDRDVTLATAVATSFRAAWANPLMTALWGLIVAAGLVIGSIPAFLGLVIVMPVLGHATWHLYRRIVAPSAASAAAMPVPAPERR
jgi:uncharacterized membrane protein